MQGAFFGMSSYAIFLKCPPHHEATLTKFQMKIVVMVSVHVSVYLRKCLLFYMFRIWKITLARQNVLLMTKWISIDGLMKSFWIIWSISIMWCKILRKISYNDYHKCDNHSLQSYEYHTHWAKMNECVGVKCKRDSN